VIISRHGTKTDPWRLLACDARAAIRIRGRCGHITAYNLGIGYSAYCDTLPREEYLQWTVEWCREAKRLLKDDGSFFLNIGAAPSHPMLPHEVVIALRDEFVLQTRFTGSSR
jgi:DNA modification methylase